MDITVREENRMMGTGKGENGMKRDAGYSRMRYNNRLSGPDKHEPKEKQ